MSVEGNTDISLVKPGHVSLTCAAGRCGSRKRRYNEATLNHWSNCYVNGLDSLSTVWDLLLFSGLRTAAYYEILITCLLDN